MCMDKKKIGLIVVILFLLVGLGTFVFANPNNEENLLKGEDNSGETLDDGENGTTEPTATPEVPGDDNTNRPTPAPTTTPEVTVPVNDGNNELPGGIGEAGRDPYEAAKAAVSQAECSLTQKDVDYAAGLVEQVTDLDLKKELLDRLFNVQNIIDATALVEQLEAMVQDATNVDEMDDARDYRVDSKVEEAVSNLVESDSKTDLLDRLSIVAKILDDKTSPVINGIKDNAYTNQSVSLTIEDANEVTMTVTLNETEIDFAEAFDEEGTYVVTVIDAAKNESTVTFTIDKTPPEVTGVENNGKYTNSVTPIVKDNNNKVMATLNGEPFVSGTTISAKGEYELIVKDEAGNEVIFKFSIVKIATVIEFVEPESLIYDGSAKEFKANLKDENGNIIDIPLSVVYEAEDGTRGNAINAGKYTAIAYFAGNDDYEKAYARKSFEITKADTVFEFIAPESLVYDGKVKEYTVTLKDQFGNTINSDYTVVYETEDGARGDAVNAGKYTLIAHFAGNENYNKTYKREAFEIEKATPTIELVEPASLVYDGKEKSYQVKVYGADGKEIEEPNMVIIYKKGNEEIYNTNNKDQGNLPVNAGTYSLGVYVRENENYTRADKWITFEIEKATPTIELVEPESLVYDGKEKSYQVKVYGADGKEIEEPNMVIIYKKGNEEIYNTNNKDQGNLPVNAGTYSLGVYVRENENYTRADKWITFEIERATPTIELVEPASLVYDGNKKEFGIKVLDVLGNPLENVSMNVIYKDATTNQELEEAPTNPGSYILGVYVRENENYTRADKWINFTIEGEILGTITVNGEKINFYSYDELFTKIPDNTETLVTLESNANQDITIPNNKNIILDLNNYVLNGDKTIINNGILSIKNGTINATNNGIINNNRIEDIDNVTINAARKGINNSNGTIVNIKNSKIEAVLYPIYNANYSTIGTLENNDVMGHFMDGIYVADNSTIYKIISGNYMSDGKSSTYGNVAGFGLYISTNATVNEIIGGVFKGSKAAVANYGSILAISGGTFEIKFNNDSWDLSNTFLYYGNVSNISGGKFYSYNGKIGFGIFRQNNYSLKDGYEFVKDGDYFIVQKSA